MRPRWRRAAAAPGCACALPPRKLPVPSIRIQRGKRTTERRPAWAKRSPGYVWSRARDKGMAADILIVDDEVDIRELVAGILQDEGYSTRTARDSDEALAAVTTRRPSLVFLDIWLQGSKLDGLQLLDAIKGEHSDLPVVMI